MDLEQWGCNDGDAMVATLGHRLSRDLTTFDTWEMTEVYTCFLGRIEG